jgi:hypothetical protein
MGLKLEQYYFFNSLLFKTQQIIGQLSIFHFVANRPRKYFRVWSNLHKAQIIGCLQKISFLFLFFLKKNLVPTYLPLKLVTNYKKLVGEGGFPSSSSFLVKSKKNHPNHGWGRALALDSSCASLLKLSAASKVQKHNQRKREKKLNN